MNNEHQLCRPRSRGASSLLPIRNEPNQGGTRLCHGVVEEHDRGRQRRQQLCSHRNKRTTAGKMGRTKQNKTKEPQKWVCTHPPTYPHPIFFSIAQTPPLFAACTHLHRSASAAPNKGGGSRGGVVAKVHDDGVILADEQAQARSDLIDRSGGRFSERNTQNNATAVNAPAPIMTSVTLRRIRFSKI